MKKRKQPRLADMFWRWRSLLQSYSSANLFAFLPSIAEIRKCQPDRTVLLEVAEKWLWKVFGDGNFGRCNGILFYFT